MKANKTWIAIGGGNFQKQETRAIDEYAISRCRKEHPHVVFLPTASHDDQGYAKRFKQYYRSLGCEVEALRLYHTKLTKAAIHQKLLEADMIYIGGGNLLALKEQFALWELKDVLKQAHDQGCVIAGLSAGANILFNYSYSDSGDDDGFIVVEGLHFVPGFFCPHYQEEARKSFDDVSQQGTKKIACADGEAWVVEDEKAYYIGNEVKNV